jgi:HEAT repeat protein
MRGLVPAFGILGVIGLCVLHAQNNRSPIAAEAAAARAWSLLTTSFSAADPRERLAAVPALTIADTPDAHALLESVARNGPPPVRQTVIWYVPSSSPSDNSMPVSGHDYFPLVADAVQDPDVSVRRTAIGRLAAFHDNVHDSRALALLQDVIARGDADTLETAVGTARNFGSSAFNVLLNGVDSENDKVVAASLRTIDVLVDPSFSSKAPDNLVALRDRRPTVLLTKALHHSNNNVRIFAALILARLGDGSGASELTRIARSQDQKPGAMSVYRAMAALNSLGRPGYLASLSAALENPESRVRDDAAWALMSFPHSSTIPVWANAWREMPAIRYWAFRSLITAKPTPDPRLLKEGLSDTSPDIRLIAAEATLTDGVNSPDLDAEALDAAEALVSFPATRNLALSLLEKRGDPQRTGWLARQLLPTAVEDDRRMGGYDPGLLSVVYALEVTRNREAVPALAALLGTAHDRDLSFRVVRALVAIDDNAAGQALVSAMDNPHGPTRALAAGGVLHFYSR